MTTRIPEQYADLVQLPIVASLATIMANGGAQVTPVWFDYDGTHFIINTAKGRVKDRNMMRNPNVTLLIVDPQNPYRYIEFRGRVVERTEEGADAHIDKQAKRYLNVDKYPYGTPEEVRVLFKISAMPASSMG